MEKEQFDEFLGGTVQLPRDVQIVKLAAARASEIAAMTYSIENPEQSKLVFQKLPVHMRRRVMSHNAKRMPRRLREAHLRQMIKSGLPPKSKRPSRKYRRRPQNLLQEYSRRKHRCEWLETHIWHAKRFHMIEKWGCKIADFPNDKSFRACYRAAAQHCLLQDISYYHCLEINGPALILKETLKGHCNPSHLSFAAKVYQQGNREGKLMFFKKNCYPQSPIGNISFVWKPGETELRTIWIWIHPLIYKSILREIVDSFEFTVVDKMDEKGSTEKSNIYTNNKNCSMMNLRGTLNRFRLTGPLAPAILSDVLHLPNLNMPQMQIPGSTYSKDNEKKKDFTMDIDEPALPNEWHEIYYQSNENLEAFKIQKEAVETLGTLKSPNQLPPNSIIAVTVLDPRFFLPHKRTKKLANGECYVKMAIPPSLAHYSPMWNTELRNRVKANCKSTNDINKLRSDNLVPGVHNDDQFDQNVMSKVPVILIQNPGCTVGSKDAGFTSGIDIIIPGGWSMPFWQAFVFRCARAGGLRESRFMAMESLDLFSPQIHQPDIPSYNEEACSSKMELEDKYFRYPPNRRVNFTKLAISSPFYYEWKILMKEWTNCETFYVLRDRILLEILEHALWQPQYNSRNKNVNERKIVVEEAKHKFDRNIFKNHNCLIPVKISMEGKGRPRNFAIICIPTSEDLQTRGANIKWSGPVQAFVKDSNEYERRKLRKEHKTILKRSNRQGHRRRKLAEEVANVLKLQKRSGKAAKLKVDNNYTLKNEYREKMAELHLPKCTEVRKSCDREIMGYVTNGDFSFTEACGIGMGYVVLDSLLKLVDANSNLILVRNTQTRQYRFARIEILNQYK